MDVVIKEMYRRDDAAHFMFRVRDTGKGMDPRFLGRLFRPFEQENASIAQQYGGSGLGMAIADSLVTLMGGEIVVDSAVGRGSDFAVYLPMQVTEAPAGQDGESGQEPPAPEGAQDAGFMDGLRMLMAEDNDVNAKITMSLLKKRGVQVERACNGEEAVELFAGHEPGYYDVILMDIKMPGIDGWEAARRIRKLEQEDPSRGRIALIALSANAFVEDERHSLEVGMDGHVGKPLDFDALDALIRRILPASQKKTKGTP